MSLFQTTSDEKAMNVDSLLSRLEENVTKSPNKEALTFIGSGLNGGVIETKLTYQDVWQQTKVLALNLLDSGIEQGDMAVLVYPPSLDFTIAFIACLRAGIVAVPVFPPQPTRKDTLLMFSTIIAACGAKYALTNTSYSYMKKLSSLKKTFTSLGRSSSPWPEKLNWKVTDTMTSSVSNQKNSSLLSSITPKPSDLAFLQFTSGSTSEPKGVMITHNNLGDNLTKITTELQAVDDTIVVSWLPQYHDMGLIGSYLGVLYCGGSGYYMSPLTYLQRPALWIEAISRFRGTHLQAPNFAFKLTSRKFSSTKYSKDTLDLSSVRHIINAAEPVTEESIDAFLTAFVPFGLKKEVMFPTYGLAEHTVFVCSGGKQRLTVSKHSLEVDGLVVEIDDTKHKLSADVASKMIGCGFPSEQNVDVKIVSTETLQAVKEDEVGEIWIRSDSKAGGYYMKPEITKREFFAEIGVDPDKDEGENSSSDSSERYLRTGDLGFLHNNELFVCGRLKDLIIIGGRNYYPQDLEATAEATDSKFRPGCSAAFTIDTISGDDEQVCIVLELREVPTAENRDSVCSELVEIVRGTITREHSLALSHIVLLHPKTVPKTSSGKIARARCRKGFLNKSLNIIYSKSLKSKSSKGLGQGIVTNEEGVEVVVPQTSEARTAVKPEEIRSLSKKQIMARLLNDVSKHLSMPVSSISKTDDLATMMDSLTLSQFKGLLQYDYATNISDGYLFRPGTSINKLVGVIKKGYAPDDKEDDVPEGTEPANTAMVGQSKGLAGMLGCPPGVKCVIM